MATEHTWEKALGQSLRTADDLAEAGFIAPEEIPHYRTCLSRYKFLLPRYYAGLIDRNDPHCPIRRQAIPDLCEMENTLTLSPDPLNDLSHRPAPRITHRYPNRVLLHVTSNCSMYCRFCFRKSLLNELAPELFGGDVSKAFAYLEAHPQVEEVIFSGGDPFLLTDLALGAFLTRLQQLPSLKRIRFHSRVPVTFPERITDALAKILASSALPVVLVAHFNHPKELTAQTNQALQKLSNAGVVLLNQSVLLAGVNDDQATLALLSEKLFEQKLMPYYLHHPDRAQGTRHFDLTPERGLALHTFLRERLPGYLVPRYVIDQPGHPYKLEVEEFQRFFLANDSISMAGC